ncbi:period circadian protein homolog 2 isoform X1 [Labeo rohita]|uniref:period circadian protein homolog 2 isoform X1 n=1 Tax=Labeo rohita TaxID=84645 RepID=UPI0021E28A14|nr:period circadian protein homolog 2 isoform X1 [Labeo rohita]XP_050985059.1 period circadian protein homolog 2 isoform X1 [Labeo rohita]XP_050985060.1 period circadian protein homolog 2 isoform X1 [Labeo rohita]XP_050985061.1 period circadian protein homolog 2 isoform X1 [Labeo rohita]
MSGETEPKPYLYRGMSEEGESESPCGSMSHLHRMGGASEGSDSSHDPPTSPRPQTQMHEDMEMGGSGSSGSGTESHSNESHSNESHGHESVGSSSGNGKDSAIMASSGSNKSSNSQSLSPPSSNNAFSLVSSEQDNPSTSGCSSEQSAKAKTQKELFKTLKELKYHLPPDKRSKGRASTLHTLRYALRCVKQVKANEEYYQMLMINDSQPSGLDVSSYTIEEINSITSEYTLKNADIFAVAVSLITGKIVYISEQAAGILNCRKDEFKDRKFVEFLTPRDVSVFYSFTTPYRLPSWSMCTGTESSSTEFMQEKSFFCRISGGKEKEGDLQYYPFRMTPYLMKVQDSELSEEHFCCLILAERVHSGYEAPRIPPDKRIFTTTHTPNCVFQDVDERAVPLLGYLPQDLIGTPLLLHLHPSDRPIMLAVHRKILQYVGQPFDQSSIRFCVRNGEYVTLDTSWCSFVNPWSRKVSFVIGRHKVRMGPMNEDVFSAPAFTEEKIMDSDIQEITEQIHRLLLQPVHSMGSSGYGSHGSNGSHEHLLSIASSSDSNGNGNTANGGNRISGFTRKEEGKSKPRSFQEICKGVHMLKAQEQQGSSSKAEQKKSFDTGFRSPVVKQKDSALLVRDGPATMEDLKDHTMYSYQQISCLDSVIRYLESCNVPNTVKRKYQFSSNTTSSNSDEDKKASDASLQQTDDSLCMEAPSSLSIKTNEKPPQGPAPGHVVGGPLSSLDLPSKADSVVSQCSYSSTIVHVGDKKTQPESEIIEDAAESPAPSAPVSVVSPPTVEQEAYKKLGLTKQVLAAHTQKEEQAFLSRCKELRNGQALQKDCPPSTQRNRGQATEAARGTKAGASVPVTDATIKKSGRTKKSKKSRTKRPDSSDNAASQHRPLPPLQGLNQTSWSPSETSQSGLSVPFPTVVPGYPLYPVVPTIAPPQAPPTGAAESQNTQATPSATTYPTPLVTPVVAFVLPSFMLPQIGTAPRSPFYADTQQAYSAVFQSQQAYNGQHSFQPQQAYNGQQPFQPQQAYNIQQPLQPQQVYTGQEAFQPQQAYSTTQHLQNTQGCSTPQCFQTHTSFTSQQSAFTPQTHYQYGMRSDPKHSIIESTECRSPLPPPQSPPLFESRCSSPLQLDLLQMEEKQDSHITAPQSSTQGNCSVVQDKNNTSINTTSSAMDDLQQACCSGNGGHCGDHSSSSSVLELLLQEDSHSAMGSATSASTGSTSNDCNTFNSGTGSNTSKYFGSVDSSENNHKSEDVIKEQEQNLVKYVLQEPVWRLTADDDDCAMMTYQVPSRDMEKVLGEDRERLRRMQKNQPRFSSEQRRELIDQHPWMRRGGLPNAINVMECMYCENDISAPLEEDLPDMELTMLGEVVEDRGASHSQEEKEQPNV